MSQSCRCTVWTTIWNSNVGLVSVSKCNIYGGIEGLCKSHGCRNICITKTQITETAQMAQFNSVNQGKKFTALHGPSKQMGYHQTASRVYMDPCTLLTLFLVFFYQPESCYTVNEYFEENWSGGQCIYLLEVCNDSLVVTCSRRKSYKNRRLLLYNKILYK